MNDLQQLIDLLAEDAQRVLARHEAARVARDDGGTALTAGELQGLRIGLGRVLAWRDGLPPEGVVTAFNRGRDYQDQLPIAERRAS